MGKLGQCLQLINLFQSSDRLWSSKELAEHLKVSRRMIRDYIEEMERAGVPVCSIRGRNGGYRLEKPLTLPELRFTTRESTALQIAIEEMQRTEKMKQNMNLQTALQRLKTMDRSLKLTDERIIYIDQYQPTHDGGREYELSLELYKTMDELQKVHISYVEEDGVVQCYTIHPYGMIFWNDSWYCRAYCEEKAEEMTFKLAFIENIVQGMEPYEIPSSFTVDDAKASVCDDVYCVELEIGGVFARTVPKRIWGEKQKITVLNGGKIRFTATMHGKKFIKKWIMGMGKDVTVTSPVSLRNEIYEEVRVMLKQYH